MKICFVVGCGKEAKSRGYCQTHYMRLHRHGTVEAGRPDWYGTKASHPLYVTYKAAKQEGRLCDAWLADFWKFVADVSPIPDGNFRLRRKDKGLPYSKENCEWRATAIERRAGETDAQFATRRKKIYSPSTPEKIRQKGLKQNHGISLEQYNAMHEAQGGVCAICGRPETKTGGVNRSLMALAVDHCYKTRQSGKSNGIRGLLCSACNIGLGKFDDDAELLRKAAAYLEKYRE